MTRQRSYSTAALAVLFVLASALVGWLAFSDAPQQDLVAGAPEVRASPPSNADRDVAEHITSIGLDAPAVRSSDTPQPARAEVSDAERLELADALWVEGRVVIPQGTPLDEQIEVIADGKKFETLGDHRVRVGNDGRFRVAFSNRTKSGSLKLEGRYVYLDTPFKVKPSAPPDDIVLEPLLGGCIRGVLVPPSGASDVDEVIAKARVTSTSWGMNEPMTQRSASIDKDLRFELRGLPTHREHTVIFEPVRWVAFQRGDVRVEPGQVLDLDIACTLGAKVRGRCVDESGEPVAMAALTLERSTKEGDFYTSSRQRIAAADGSFEFVGVSPGSAKIVGAREGYLEATVEIGELVDGASREGVELVFRSGAFVAGVVKWDDGQLAAGAYVRVEGPSGAANELLTMDFNESLAHRVDSDGRFRISGLGAGPFTVSAQAAEGAKPEFDVDGKPIKKSKLKGPKWRAQLENVAVGAEVELVLRPGLSISGRTSTNSARRSPRRRCERTPCATAGVSRSAQTRTGSPESSTPRTDASRSKV